MSDTTDTEFKGVDNTDYIEDIKALLSNYEDGWDVFKKQKHWDDALIRKDKAKNDHTIPDTWLELVERVVGIVAKGKYNLDTYENLIEIISADQMLDAYASHGMPASYDHWSFGMQRVMEEQQYKQGKKGLAYEIVVNTDPAIAYCMEANSPLMQMLVIAHASFGHNNFFKKNHLFRQFTDAKTIVDDLRMMRDYIRECEEKYGYEEVEKLLDACHALELHAVHRYSKPKKKDPKELAERAKEKREERFSTPRDSSIYDDIKGSRASSAFEAASKETEEAKKKAAKGFISADNEENLLMYLADNAPHLPEWKRRIMRMICHKAQYFYPQMQTQVMNEGWASFWHYTLLHDMRDLDLIDDGMMQEFLDSHAGVLFQPDFDSPYFSGQMNPYTLGFNIFQDIKRMCLEPTDEDREWFPDIAGNPDWLGTMKEAMENFKDESFLLQYLSPKVIRDMRLFALEDDYTDSMYEINAIHDKEGYRRVREALASNKRLGDLVPYLEVDGFYAKTDRSLHIKHKMINENFLDEGDTQEVLKHIYQIWEHPVFLETVGPDDEPWDEFSCPPNYEYQASAHEYKL